jgi:hypothetical protein
MVVTMTHNLIRVVSGERNYKSNLPTDIEIRRLVHVDFFVLSIPNLARIYFFDAILELLVRLKVC